jgi:glycerol dehydrogenase-like iron-containing ADH family enzyme
LAGRAMEKTSKYGSQSEHEIEKALTKSPEIARKYPHGQLVGAGTLIASKLYQVYHNSLPKNLFFDSRRLYKDIVNVFKHMGLLDYVKQPLKEVDEKELLNYLKTVSTIRPERYNLWNEVDSEHIEWGKILSEVAKKDQRSYEK